MDEFFKKIIEESHKLKEATIFRRRTIHSFAEVGFNTEKTIGFLKNELSKIGIPTKTVGRGGLVGYIGEKKGKTTLLRADIDALPIKEKTGEIFASSNKNMHACGHDFHAAMLLSASEILFKYRKKIQGRIVIFFQSAEETLEGARDIVDSGFFEEQQVNSAIMMHVLTGVEFPCGYTIVSSKGVSAPSSDFFEISVRGKSSHGSTSHLGKNALATAARILLSIEELPSREFGISDDVVLSVGMLNSGVAPNVIADFAKLCGTFRAYDESARKRMHDRVAEISKGIAALYSCRSEIKIASSCPTLMNDGVLSDNIYSALVNSFGKNAVTTSRALGVRGGGSDDFAYISHKVPSVMIALAAGSARDGYSVPLHNPKTRFDESALVRGTAIYAIGGIASLE